MKFSIFASAKAQKGEECTYEKWLQVTNDIVDSIKAAEMEKMNFLD